MTDVLEGTIQIGGLTAQVRVVGVGVNEDVAVPEGSPLAEAIAQAVGEGADDLTVQRNGETIDPNEVEARDGDVIVVVPPAVKLG